MTVQLLIGNGVVIVKGDWTDSWQRSMIGEAILKKYKNVKILFEQDMKLKGLEVM